MTIIQFRKHNLLPMAIIFMVATACTKQTNSPNADDKIIAEVAGSKLYLSEIIPVLSKGISEADSTKLVNEYAKNWVKRQLLLNYAKKSGTINTQNIEKKVEDYRYSLLLYEYRKEYIKTHLNTEITIADAQKYYEENKNDLKLTNELFKGIFVIIPPRTPQLNEIKKWLQKPLPQQNAELISACTRYAEKFDLSDSVWYQVDDVFAGTGFFEDIASGSHLINGKPFMADDERGFCFVKATSYAAQNQTPPLDFIMAEVKRRIINERRSQLLDSLEHNIMTEAKNSGNFKLYVEKN